MGSHANLRMWNARRCAYNVNTRKKYAAGRFAPAPSEPKPPKTPLKASTMGGDLCSFGFSFSGTVEVSSSSSTSAGALPDTGGCVDAASASTSSFRAPGSSVVGSLLASAAGRASLLEDIGGGPGGFLGVASLGAEVGVAGGGADCRGPAASGPGAFSGVASGVSTGASGVATGDEADAPLVGGPTESFVSAVDREPESVGVGEGGVLAGTSTVPVAASAVDVASGICSAHVL